MKNVPPLKEPLGEIPKVLKSMCQKIQLNIIYEMKIGKVKVRTKT